VDPLSSRPALNLLLHPLASRFVATAPVTPTPDAGVHHSV
jgi:hypothetical protein